MCLGLTTAESWELTPREFQALADIHDGRRRDWALERAQFCNVFLNGDGAGWTVEDFLGTGNRPERVEEACRKAEIEKCEEMHNRLVVAKMNMDNQRPREEDVPQWAKDAAANSKGRLGSNG